MLFLFVWFWALSFCPVTTCGRKISTGVSLEVGSPFRSDCRHLEKRGKGGERVNMNHVKDKIAETKESYKKYLVLASFLKVYLLFFERGRERIPGRLHTVSTETDVGLKLTNRDIMTWAEIKSWTLNRLSHPGAPYSINFVRYLPFVIFLILKIQNSLFNLLIKRICI